MLIILYWGCNTGKSFTLGMYHDMWLADLFLMNCDLYKVFFVNSDESAPPPPPPPFFLPFLKLYITN